jgi:hypothetical protein
MIQGRKDRRGAESLVAEKICDLNNTRLTSPNPSPSQTNVHSPIPIIYPAAKKEK